MRATSRHPRLPLWVLCLLLLWFAAPASAATRVIVRVEGGLPLIQTLCRLLGCTVQYGLDDPLGQVFLITTPNLLSVQLLLAVPGVLDVELDQTGRTKDATIS